MGTFLHPITLIGPLGASETLEALVDPDAMFTVIPAPILERLGVRPFDTIPVRFANGQIQERPLGHLEAELEGQRMPVLCLFGSGDAPTLIGAHTLEAFLVAVDPVEQKHVHKEAYLMLVEGVDRLRWRVHGLLGTSGRPGRDKGRQHRPTLADVGTWVEAARGMGFKSIICFLEPQKLEKWYGGVHPEGLLGYYNERGFTVFHFPAEDYQPVPADVKERSFEAFASAPKPIVLQDSGGADRTGAVARYIIQRLSRKSAHARIPSRL